MNPKKYNLECLKKIATDLQGELGEKDFDTVKEALQQAESRDCQKLFGLIENFIEVYPEYSLSPMDTLLYLSYINIYRREYAELARCQALQVKCLNDGMQISGYFSKKIEEKTQSLNPVALEVMLNYYLMKRRVEYYKENVQSNTSPGSESQSTRTTISSRFFSCINRDASERHINMPHPT